MFADIRDFGATGRGTIDTAAIRAAIAAADHVIFPAGHYLSFSVPLRSGIHIHLAEDCVWEAANPAVHGGVYDEAESNPHDLWQDFGHSHWRNSLISGIDVEGILIDGPGLINGRGLTREGPGSRWRRQAGEFPLSMQDLSAEDMAVLSPDVEAMRGLGNKTIGLCRARNVILRDFTILNGGHFAVLATGVDDLAIENLLIDSNRDGLDIDGCRRVTIRGCRVNTPNDDAIVLKAGYSLGEARPTEDVIIEDCHVSGFDLGTLYDGTRGRTQARAPDQDRVTGRIKIGTESAGDFRRIRIQNCTFERSRGLAIETVDGGMIEDLNASNLTLREVTTAPLFLRVGARLRAPEGTRPGAIRNVVIRNVAATGILADYSALIMGLPNVPVENVRLENIQLTYDGGGTEDDARRDPPDLADAYPEPSMFGRTPAFGLWTRHMRDLSLINVELATTEPDLRPAVRHQNTTFAQMTDSVKQD